MRRNIAIIGLSSFGYYLCKNLSEAGVQVMAIDYKEDRVDSVKPWAKKAILADAKDKEVLKNLQINEFDAVVVSVGEKLDTSVLVTLYLKELGTKNIIAKATNSDQAKILKIIGASEIVFPERDIAARFAYTLRRSNLLDYFPLSEKYGIVEIAPPEPWIGKTLVELDVRKEHNIQIVMIREILPHNLEIIPSGEHVIKETDVLIVLGTKETLEKVEKI